MTLAKNLGIYHQAGARSPSALIEEHAPLVKKIALHLMARLPNYLAWLVKEIAVSNIATGKIILGGRARPVLFTTPATQRTAAGLVTYANSITLTPGTVTIEVEEAEGDHSHEFLIHALAPDFRDDVNSGDMDRRCRLLEPISSVGGAS